MGLDKACVDTNWVPACCIWSKQEQNNARRESECRTQTDLMATRQDGVVQERGEEGGLGGSQRV